MDANQPQMDPQPQQEPQPQSQPVSSGNNTGLAMVAYILFFVPLLMGEKSTFVKYHTNQGFLLFIFSVGVSIVGSVVPVLGWFLVLPVGSIMTLVFLVMGIMHAMNGEMKPLPLIGKYELLK